MEVLKSERTISRISDASELNFGGEAIYLWVIHANKIPPHLGISKGNSFFSLKANGKDDGLAIEKILPILSRKNIATVFYEIQSDLNLMSLQAAFDEFDTTVSGAITCLEPLKVLFDNSRATWLKELLSDLEDKEYIRNAFGWQLPSDFQGIPDYNPKDIHRRLQQLSNV